MNKSFAWILGALLSTSLLAQTTTNPAPATAAGTPTAAVAPAKKEDAPAPARKSSTTVKAPRKTPAPVIASEPLKPGPATVAANNVNVRGKARLKSEIITRLSKGAEVTVVEEIILKSSAADEPSAWAKILLPAGVHVWVNTAFIDTTNKTVRATKLNVRSGAGENFSVLGQLQRGDTVTEVSTKGEWTQIAAPTNAYAFVAAAYLQQQQAQPPVIALENTQTNPPVAVVENTQTNPPATQAVSDAPVIAGAPTNAPAIPPDTNVVAAVGADAGQIDKPTEPEPATEPVTEEPAPKRIVSREGIVRPSTSIQAPTSFSLYAADTGRLINYLYTTSPNVDLNRYKGLRIVVTGEESLDKRWKLTPVITIQKILVIE